MSSFVRTAAAARADRILREHERAVEATKRGTARSWVKTDDRGAVVAYDALTAHHVTREDIPQIVGARLVAVDAIAEPVARLDETLGFRRVPGSLLLVQEISDIEASLEA